VLDAVLSINFNNFMGLFKRRITCGTCNGSGVTPNEWQCPNCSSWESLHSYTWKRCQGCDKTFESWEISDFNKRDYTRKCATCNGTGSL
jgi:DnaJ-class molecular chaperone